MIWPPAAAWTRQRNASYDDATVSPVVRQTLLHWAYTLTESDFMHGAKRVRSHGATYVPREQLDGILAPKAKAASKAANRAHSGADEASSAVDSAAAIATSVESRSERAARRARGEATAPASSDEAAAGRKRRRRCGAAPAAVEAAPLAAYEQEREATKARNQAKLQELGLVD